MSTRNGRLSGWAERPVSIGRTFTTPVRGQAPLLTSTAQENGDGRRYDARPSGQ
jgi:hypothetical protein